MRIIQVVAVAFLFLFSTSTWGAEGLIAVKSPHSSKATMDRLENLAKQQGMMIFARIDHAAAAAKTGKKLRSTELLIFGNPLGGTPFMDATKRLVLIYRSRHLSGKTHPDRCGSATTIRGS